MNKRQQIIDALAVRLRTIQKPTYSSDVGDRVYVWRSKVIADKELPAINIYYGREPDEIIADSIKGPGQVWDRRLPVVVSIETKSSETTEEAEQIESDILKAIGVDETFGALAVMTNPVNDSFNIAQEEHRIVGAEMTFNIIYRTDQYEH